MLRISTKKKIIIASVISRFLILVRKLFNLDSTVLVKRQGVRWQLDLREGIDLAIYLGVYESDTIKELKKMVEPGSIILDIGANIGALTLPLAILAGRSGYIIAFEPTQWAYDKLKTNLSLNPYFNQQVRIEQAMLLSKSTSIPTTIYSSWPLDRKEKSEENLLHPHHQGKLMITDGAKGITLDQFIQENPVHQIDWIKLDVDGYELTVLQGAKLTLAKYRPKIVLEIAAHVQQEEEQLEDLLIELKRSNYQLYNLTTKELIRMDKENIQNLCPKYGSINVLAIPR